MGLLAERSGNEPLSHPVSHLIRPLKIKDNFGAWQEWQGSNLRPPVLETGALPIELHSYWPLL